MTVLIGLALIVGLAYGNYGSVRRFFSRTPSANPVLARLDANRGVSHQPDREVGADPTHPGRSVTGSLGRLTWVPTARRAAL